MDGQQSNAPEQYFESIDETAEVLPSPQDMNMVAVSGNVQDGRFHLSTYMPPGSGTQVQHGPFISPATGRGHLTPAGASPYGFQPVPDSGPVSFQAVAGWQQAGNQLIFANTTAMAGPADAPLSTFGYMPYNEQQHESQAETYAPPFDHSYVGPPANMGLSMQYAYDWDAQGATNPEHGSAPLHSPTGHGNTPISLIESGTGPAGTPSSFTSTSSGGQYSSMYTGAANIHSQAAAGMGDSLAFAAGGDGRESTRQAKRAKRKARAPLPTHRAIAMAGAAQAPIHPAQTLASSSGSGESRGGSQAASSRIARPPAERVDDKRARGSSHNLVEKQYRSRLNARFEDLMKALPPENLRFQGSGGGAGDGGGGLTAASAGAAGAAERRASKAEVLVMARQHIQSLERQRDTLERERDELRGSTQRLQEIHASQAASQGQIDEGWRGEGEAEGGDGG